MSSAPSLFHWSLFLASSCFKLLIGLYSYRSTDFDVHRNWKALVQNAPISNWYCDSPGHSMWTLDYPPLFALFEYIISLPVKLFNPNSELLSLDVVTSASFECVLYMRFTVVLSDLVLLFGLVAVANAYTKGGNSNEERLKGEDLRT